MFLCHTLIHKWYTSDSTSNTTVFSYFQLWLCEFCGTSNVADIVAEELPREEDTTYMIAPAPTTATQALQGSGITDSVVVFCIDTSGSMGVTTEVDITHMLRLVACLR